MGRAVTGAVDPVVLYVSGGNTQVCVCVGVGVCVCGCVCGCVGGGSFVEGCRRLCLMSMCSRLLSKLPPLHHPNSHVPTHRQRPT